MIISAHYVEKMWPNFERQQAIERLIKQKGKAYILPVRLDGYSGDVPGLTGTIGFLAVNGNEPERWFSYFSKRSAQKGRQAKPMKPDWVLRIKQHPLCQCK